MPDYIFHEPATYAFKDQKGHSGKVYKTEDSKLEYLTIECEEKLTCSFIERECERTYFVLKGRGYFTFNDANKQTVETGDVVVIPAGTKFTFGGKLKMLLIDTPRYSDSQQEVYE